MNHRFAAAGVAVLFALAACGGDDDAADVPAPSDTVETPTTEMTTETAGDEPVATIAPDLPEPFLGGVGPVAVVGASLPELPDGDDDPAVGMRAPILIGEDLDGAPIRVDASVDGPTWLVFLAHWCPHCNDEIPVINELRDSGAIPDGVNVVGVSTASSPDRPNWPPTDWLEEKDWTFTGVLDGVDTAAGSFIAAEAFGLTAFPFSVLIDGDGVVVQRWSGGREASELSTYLTNSLI